MRFAITLDIDEAACEAHIVSDKGTVDLAAFEVNQLLAKVSDYVQKKLNEEGIPN